MKCITFFFIIPLVLCTAPAVEITIGRCPTVRLQNGRVRTRGRGRIVRFSCYDGFTLVGNRYSTCIRGEWDTPGPVCVNSLCPELAKPDHALVISKYDGAILIYFCEPGYKLIGTAEIYCDGRQWNGSSPYCRDTLAVAPESCDFEKPDLCWWEQDPKHDFDWRRHNFETPSAHIGTGPTYDHTLGPGNNGYYLYIEASGRLVNDTARIISPIYNSSLTHSGCFSFWYHMYGDTIGALRVYFKPETESTPRLMFDIKGNQGNQWLNHVFQLPAVDSNFQIIIEGVRGSNYVSDIAVDDVAILHGSECITKKNTTVLLSDEDQFETFNAAQSCRGRCINAIWDRLNSDPLSDNCHCTLDCAENSTCCPDYAVYCVLESSADVTDIIDTTSSVSSPSSLKTSTWEEIPVTESLQISTKLLKPLITVDIRESSSESKTSWTPSRIEGIAESITEASSNNRLKTSVIVLNVTAVKTEMTEVPSITIDDVDTSKNYYNVTENSIHMKNEKSQYIHPETVFFGSPETVGTIIGTIVGISITAVAIFIILKKFKTYKRSTHGSALSEDSDVRFLTTDEILDFTVARPTNDY